MEKTSALSVSNGLIISKSRFISFTILLALTLFIPLLHNNQFLVGSVVNALLLITLFRHGKSAAMLLGMLPSTMALVRGILPLPLAPMLPFIVISNAIFVLSFDLLKTKKYFFRLIFSSLFKAVFLYIVVLSLMPSILPTSLINKLVLMMSWPQFVTALLGGFIAYGYLKVIVKK